MTPQVVHFLDVVAPYYWALFCAALLGWGLDGCRPQPTPLSVASAGAAFVLFVLVMTAGS